MCNDPNLALALNRAGVTFWPTLDTLVEALWRCRVSGFPATSPPAEVAGNFHLGSRTHPAALVEESIGGVCALLDTRAALAAASCTHEQGTMSTVGVIGAVAGNGMHAKSLELLC